MAHKCIVFGCNSKSSLHLFPTNVANDWTRFVQRTRVNWVGPSLVIALLYSLCIHKIGLRISVHNFLSDLVTAGNKSRQKTRVTNLLSKALQDNMHEMIDKN